MAISAALTDITEREHAKDALNRANAELEARVQERTAELSKANEALKALKDGLADDLAAMNRLHELGTRLVEINDLQELLEEILDAIIALQRADFGNIQLYDRETGTLKIVAQRGFKQDFLDYFDNVHEGQAACGLALRQRHRVIIEDVEVDPGFTPHRQIAASTGFRAVQSTPLFSRDGEPIGVLSTHFRRPHRPSERDLRLTDLYFRLAAELIESKRAEETLRKGEERFRAFVTASSDVVYRMSADWTEMRHLQGKDFVPDTEDSSRAWLDKYIHPDDQPRVLAAINEAIGAKSVFELEHRVIRVDGTLGWTSSRAIPLLDAQGEIVEWFGAARDVTERKEAEEALRESEQRLGFALAAATMGVWSWDIPSNRVFLSPESYKLLGVESLEETLEGVTSLVHPEDLTRVMGAVEEAIATRGLYEAEFRIVRPDGETIWISNYGRATYDATGQPQRMLGVAMDITERKRSEQALRRSEARMGGIIDSAMDAIISVDDRRQIVLFNAAAEKMFGYSAAEVIGRPISLIIPERFRASHESHIRRFGATGETSRAMGALGAVSGLRRDGEEFPIEASISHLEAGGQKFFTVILRDITERKRAEEQLIEHAALLDQSHEAIVVRDLDNRVRYWSRGAERLYGWTAEEAVGRPVQELTYRENLAQLVEVTGIVIEKGAWDGEIRQLTKDGREVIVEGHWTLVGDAEGNPRTILAINTDVTEKKKLESQFLRAQRLESIGTLASGIAHDLNNILSPITMGAQMLQMKQQDEQSWRLLEVMRTNAERGAEMVKQVLSFAKGAGGERVTIQPKHLIREILKVAEETFPKSIRITQHLSEGLWATIGDATQLHQVLMNLCLNARDAMPQGGALAIKAENHTLDEVYAGMLKGASPGKYVVISISDTGHGIPSEIIDRIFDPFFTTKEQGRGTGLGLATVQGIITSHGGFITVESKHGMGTKFKIHLPAHEAASRKETEEEHPEIPFGAGEMILVIDDEAAIREMTLATLERFGYRALTADNGATALGLFASHKEEIGVVITDMMMPVMDGPVTIRALRKLNPQVRIIASSGLTDSIDAADLDQLGVKTFLTKPYDVKTLLKTVAQALR